MNIPSASTLKKLLSLQSKKESLKKQILSIEAQLSSLFSQSPSSKSTPSKGKAAKGRKKRKIRGPLGPGILKALHDADAKGLHVKQLSSAIGSTPASVGVWLVTTGKKFKQIRKVKPATYALKA